MKLVKSSYNKVLTGVCGGIGNYLNVDPTLVRVAFAVSSFFFGVSILIYIARAFIIPSEY
ncbi:MAG: PspC domain-containing protein [Flammeovirgaceae bacterium]|nr:PspC domain-containing protein [Flammeovirgaceae bacterium]